MAVLVKQSAPRSAILPGQCFLSAFRAFGHGVFHPPFIRLNTKWKYNKKYFNRFFIQGRLFDQGSFFPTTDTKEYSYVENCLFSVLVPAWICTVLFAVQKDSD